MKIKEQKIMREFFLNQLVLSWGECRYAQFYTFSIPKVLIWLLIQLMTFGYYSNLSSKRLTSVWYIPLS